MAQVTLDIVSNAHLAGIEAAQKSLESLGAAKDKANQTFRGSTDLEQYRGQLERLYHTAALAKGETAAMTVANNTYRRGLEEIQRQIGDGKKFTFIDEQGGKVVSDNLDLVQRKWTEMFQAIQAESMKFQAEMTKRGMGEERIFSYEGLEKELERTGEALGMFGSELDVVKMKMARIKEEGLKLVASQGTESEAVQNLSADYQALAKEHDRLANATSGTGTRIKNLVKNFVSAQMVVWAIRRVFQGFVNVIKDSIQAVSDLEQTASRVEAVFQGLGVVEQTVAKVATQFGIARSSAAGLMADLGGMAVGFGASVAEAAEFSEVVASALSDIMAFRDITGTIEDFGQRFVSGLAGNVQNFRAIGSVVRASMVDVELQRMGLDKLTGTSLEWAKVQARLNIVLRQQERAIGATEREWDTLHVTQQRIKETSKEIKESIGTEIITAYKPLLKIIDDIGRAYARASRARQNLVEGKLELSPLADFDDPSQSKASKKAVLQFLSQQPGTVSLGPKTWGITPEHVEAAARAFGVSAVAIGENVLNKVGEDYMQKLRDIDNRINKEKEDILQAGMAESEASSYLDWVEAVIFDIKAITGLSSKFEDSGFFGIDRGSLSNASALSTVISDILGSFKDMNAQELLSPMDLLLGDDYEDALVKKRDKLIALYGAISDEMYLAINRGDTSAAGFLEENLKDIAQVAKEVGEEIDLYAILGSLSEWKSRIASFDKLVELEKEYGEEAAEIASIKHQEWESLVALNAEVDKAISKGADRTEAERIRAALVEMITGYYKKQVGYAQTLIDKTKEQNELDRQSSVEKAGGDPIQRLEREIAIIGMSDIQRASQEIMWALNDYYNDLIEAGASEIEAREYSTRYYRLMIQKQTAEEIEEREKAAKEVVEAMRENIVNKLKAQTDWGLMEDIIEGFTEGGVWGGIAVIAAELLQYMETTKDALNMLSGFFEKIGPFLDQVAEPLMPIMEMIFQILADLIVPVLITLFPLFKGLALVLLPLMAVIRTVTNFFSWLGDTIDVFIWNLTHWLNKKDYRDLGDETAEIWEDMWGQMESIAKLELKYRLDFVDQLTDAQKGELKAYEKMYQSGLLTLSQFEAMVQREIYGRNVNTVEIPSFARGGDFITTGEQIIRVGEAGAERVTITPLGDTRYATGGMGGVSNAQYNVIVNGANGDPEAIAQAVRRELMIMERRGYKYA